MKVAVSTITCRGCGRVMAQSIPREADPEEIEHATPCNYPFAKVGPCPVDPQGVPHGLPLLWTVQLLEVPADGEPGDPVRRIDVEEQS